MAQAQDYERAGNLSQAIRSYNLLIEVTSSSADIAFALQRVASLKKLQGDPTARETQNRLLINYPSTTQALEELRSLLAANEPVSPYVRGLVYYRHNNYDSAEIAFREQLDGAPDDRASAEAAYYLAAIAESRAFESFGCSSIQQFGARVADYTGHMVYDLLRIGRLLRDCPDLDAAFRSGRLSWSKVRTLAPVVTNETAAGWIDTAARQSTAQLEHMVGRQREPNGKPGMAPMPEVAFAVHLAFRNLCDEIAQWKAGAAWIGLLGPSVSQGVVAQGYGAIERCNQLRRKPLNGWILHGGQTIGEKLRRRQDVAQVVADLAHGQPE